MSQPFSKKWMWISMAIFIASEILIGYFVGYIIVGKYVSIGLKFMMQGICMLLGFYIGGIIIGFISPGVRIWEPAAGAFLSVAIMMTLALFTPSRFFYFSLTRVLVGGGIAFFLALSGAKTGEKLAGNKHKLE